MGARNPFIVPFAKKRWLAIVHTQMQNAAKKRKKYNFIYYFWTYLLLMKAKIYFENDMPESASDLTRDVKWNTLWVRSDYICAHQHNANIVHFV